MISPRSHAEDAYGASPPDYPDDAFHFDECAIEWEYDGITGDGAHEWRGVCDVCDTTFVGIGTRIDPPSLPNEVIDPGTCPEGCAASTYAGELAGGRPSWRCERALPDPADAPGFPW